jgi:LacI family transcriptional regulator
MKRYMTTLKDVARRAGCSIAAVSLVLNQKAGRAVGRVLQEAILRAARSLGYRKNPLAVHLQKGRTGRLAVLTSRPLAEYATVGNNSFFETLSGLVTAASQKHYTCGVLSAEEARDAGSLARLLQDNQIEGVFFFHRHWEGAGLRHLLEALRRARVAGVPLTFAEPPPLPGTFVNFARSGAVAGRHFRECGLKQAAFLGFPHPASAHRYATLKLEGMTAGLRRAYRHAPFLGDPRRAARLPGPVGILCEDNLTAHRLLRLLRDAGRPVPEEVQVLGHGGAAYADLFPERVSHLRSVTTRQGPAALEIMEAGLEDRSRAPFELIEELVAQHTTRPLPR